MFLGRRRTVLEMVYYAVSSSLVSNVVYTFRLIWTIFCAEKKRLGNVRRRTSGVMQAPLVMLAGLLLGL